MSHFSHYRMANRILCVTNLFRNSFRNLTISTRLPVSIQKCEQLDRFLLKNVSPVTDTVRHTSFFGKLTAEEIWKGCTTVSNAGMKRGRARRINKRNIRDLNKGQVIGVGKANMVWPGLNAPVIRDREIVQREKRPEDTEWAANLHKVRDAQNLRAARVKLNPLERGWSGNKMPGRSIGEPDAIGEHEFNGFDTRVLEMKMVFCMKGNLGRSRRQMAFVIVGNKNGLAGFAMGKSPDARVALRKAKNRAAQKLIHIPLCDGHTVFHDFFCQFGQTKIYVQKKPEGHGLVCHRAIKTIAETIGIKNMYAKVECSTNNAQHICKAFFIGLLQQKNYQQLAEEKGLCVVESRKDRHYLPVVRAEPGQCRTAEDLKHNEVLDFTQHCLNGRVILRKGKLPPFYTKLESYKKFLKRHEKRRSHDVIKHQCYVRYGELRSFLTDKYPECVPYAVLRRRQKESGEIVEP